MSDKNSGHQEFEDLIDKAIDEMFVARPAPEEESAPAATQEVETPPQEPAEEIDLSLSWDQSPSTTETGAQGADASSFGGSGGSSLFEAPPAQAAAGAESPANPAADENEEEEEDGAPSLAALKPVYQAMLSLDWDITADNISAVEKEFETLREIYSTNYHLESAVKLALITCKYLRASKAYATPLAIRYLQQAVTSCEVFLSERGPGKPSPEALTNDLLGLYNDMKTDANRLRAVALRGRAQAQAYKPAPKAAVPAPPAAGAADPMRKALLGLWDSMEQIRGRLRGASAQGAPFAEAIDSSCQSFQVDLKAAIALAEANPAQSSEAKLNALEITAQELDGALKRFKLQLAELRAQ